MRTNSFKNLTRTKELALAKLDKLVLEELNRLHVLYPNQEESLAFFDLKFDKNYFTKEEKKEIKPNIDMLLGIQKEREKRIAYLKLTMQTRQLENPWKSAE